MRLLRARGLADLGKVASGSVTQCFWLGNRKVGSQEVGNNRSRLPGRGTVLEKLDEEEEPATERRLEGTQILGWIGEREEEVAWHASALALAMRDKVCREA